jgi:hypothetical protein
MEMNDDINFKPGEADMLIDSLGVSKDDVVFCGTNVSIYPVVSFTQYIIEGVKLITLIGELHDNGPGTHYRLPAGYISVTTYARQVLDRNPHSMLLLEIGETDTEIDISRKHSRVIRDMAIPYKDRVVRFDVRDKLMSVGAFNQVYNNGLTLIISGKYVPMYVSDLRVAGILLDSTELENKLQFIRKTSIPKERILQSGIYILKQCEIDVNEEFKQLRLSVENAETIIRIWGEKTGVCRSGITQNFGDTFWTDWNKYCVWRAKRAWGYIVDYFLLTRIFMAEAKNEFLINIGYHHSDHINRLFSTYAGANILCHVRPVDACVKLGGNKVFKPIMISDRMRNHENTSAKEEEQEQNVSDDIWKFNIESLGTLGAHMKENRGEKPVRKPVRKTVKRRPLKIKE